MKYAVFLAASAVPALAGCGKSASADGATILAQAEASDGVVFTVGAAPSPEFMVGKWGEPGECELALEFRPNGTMIGPFEKWRLDGDVLDMEGNPQKIRLTVIDANTMETRIDNEKPRRLARCP